ncbi:hypothetical protein [Nocardia sp. R7R-8]
MATRAARLVTSPLGDLYPARPGDGLIAPLTSGIPNRDLKSIDQQQKDL